MPIGVLEAKRKSQNLALSKISKSQAHHLNLLLKQILGPLELSKFKDSYEVPSYCCTHGCTRHLQVNFLKLFFHNFLGYLNLSNPSIHFNFQNPLFPDSILAQFDTHCHTIGPLGLSKLKENSITIKGSKIEKMLD